MSKIAWTDVIIERFWGNVQMGPGCWVWTAGRFSNGYGQFRAGKRKLRAHRAAWELTHGPIPDGKLICHHCDTPLCVRPSHLFLGTAAENTADMHRKGRWRLVNPRPQDGVKNPAAKLTEAQVGIIREQQQSGVTQRQLAAEFGMSPSQIGNIVHRRCWQESA